MLRIDRFPRLMSHSRILCSLLMFGVGASMPAPLWAAERTATEVQDSSRLQNQGPRNEESAFEFIGPSLHLFGGGRLQKPSNEDLFDTETFGLRVTPFSLKYSEEAYVAFLAPGLSYVGNYRYSFNFAPIIVFIFCGLVFGVVI